MSRKQLDRILLAVVALAAFGLPLVVTSPTYLQILILLFFYAYLTTAWNLVGGFAGVLPLGHSVFVGIGAYTSTILTLQYGVSPWIGMLVGGLLAAVVGVIIGLPTFRLRGAYFAIGTWVLAEVVKLLITNNKGDVIRGLSRMPEDSRHMCFHAGTAEKDGQIVANGGRVLNITARGDTLAEARNRAYAMRDHLDWPGGFCRSDIGWRAL